MHLLIIKMINNKKLLINNKKLLTIKKSRAIFMKTGVHDGAGFLWFCVKQTGGLQVKKENIVRITKYLLDFMFFAGILVTAALPFLLKIGWVGIYLPKIKEHYAESVIIYFILGLLALVILGELRKMFRTVLADDCFVYDNVVSLQRIGTYSFMIALVAMMRTIVYLTPSMLVVILVFLVAGLFSKVLAFVFDRAVKYKEENDLTI